MITEASQRKLLTAFRDHGVNARRRRAALACWPGNGNKAKTADELGPAQAATYRKIGRYGIAAPEHADQAPARADAERAIVTYQ